MTGGTEQPVGNQDDESKSSVEASRGEVNQISAADEERARTVEEAAALAEDVSDALEFWREFDLDTRREDLEEQCESLKAHKNASISGRKRLNELTKHFRSQSKQPAEQGGMMTELLKAYQEEIDQLSRRSKHSEACFLKLCKGLYPAPDPCHALQGLMAQANGSGGHLLQVERLQRELRAYDEEFQRLKNQDITIRR